jgi:hypothetical protein
MKKDQIRIDHSTFSDHCGAGGPGQPQIPDSGETAEKAERITTITESANVSSASPMCAGGWGREVEFNRRRPELEFLNKMPNPGILESRDLR